MNKALMYFYSAVDACQKDNEKYAEAIKKSWNLNIRQTKVKLIKDTIDNSEVDVVREVIDKTIFTDQHQSQLDKLNAEKEKLKLQLKEMKEKHRAREKANRELEDNKREFIILKEREIKELMTQKQYAKDCALARLRNKKEEKITKEEAKKVAVVRTEKYNLVSQLTSWIDKKKVSERSIEKANGVKVLLNREIKAGIRVDENTAEIKKIDEDIVKWKKTIVVAGEKRAALEEKIAKVDARIARINEANKARREKRRAILKKKNSKVGKI